jgi:hypothetical protein
MKRCCTALRYVGERGSGRTWSLMIPELTEWGVPRRVLIAGATRLHKSRIRAHNLLSPKNSLRKAGQRKRENQLFFCLTFIFVEMPMVVPVLELLLQQHSYCQDKES